MNEYKKRNRENAKTIDEKKRAKKRQVKECKKR